MHVANIFEVWLWLSHTRLVRYLKHPQLQPLRALADAAGNERAQLLGGYTRTSATTAQHITFKPGAPSQLVACKSAGGVHTCTFWRCSHTCVYTHPSMQTARHSGRVSAGRWSVSTSGLTGSTADAANNPYNCSYQLLIAQVSFQQLLRELTCTSCLHQWDVAVCLRLQSVGRAVAITTSACISTVILWAHKTIKASHKANHCRCSAATAECILTTELCSTTTVRAELHMMFTDGYGVSSAINVASILEGDRMLVPMAQTNCTR